MNEALPLVTLQPKPRKRWWKPWLLSLFRCTIVVLIVMMMRHHFERLRVQGNAPIELSEVKEILPEAARLQIDTGPRSGLLVFDSSGSEIGYAIRTSPQAEDVIGYAGPTDTLLVFGSPDKEPNPKSMALPYDAPEPSPLDEPTRKLLGIQIRHSWDTTRHIKWVKEDAWFNEFWQGRDWDNLATIDFYDEYMEGVSGATLSSMGIARSIQERAQWSTESANQNNDIAIRTSATDYGLWIAMAIGLLATFKTGWKKKQSLWIGIRLAAIVYVGFLNGSLLALSLTAGYAAHGIAWQLAPGLVSLLAVSLIIPIATRRNLYCSHICPHGAAQQLLSRYTFWSWTPPRKVAAGLKWLPFILLAIAMTFLILKLPLELAYLEPFDAYLFRQSDWIPVIIAISSLIIAAVVPLAYCKYGCPTGMLLEFFRSHGRADKFGRRDWAVLALLGLTYLLTTQYEAIQLWLGQARS